MIIITLQSAKPNKNMIRIEGGRRDGFLVKRMKKSTEAS